MKIDLKKEVATYRARKGSFDIVEVPPLQYLMVDGRGDPDTEAYGNAISALFGVAYKLKFASKRQFERDFVVMPLEALWWSDDMSTFTVNRDKSRWSWTAMVAVPDWITGDDLEEARAAVAEKGANRALDELRLERYEEGRCVQTLHVGPFDDEGPVLDEMHNVSIPGAGLRMTGKHHEIYLSDIRSTDPAKLRTILRQPVATPSPGR